MSKLREKAKFNLAAAELLQENNYFAPSVHCSYYSCFQIMKFTINDFFGISYEELAIKVQNSDQNTHAYVINYIGNQIRAKKPLEYVTFNRNIKDLKEFREKSDYDDIEINTTQSKKALGIAKELRIQMTKIFHI